MSWTYTPGATDRDKVRLLIGDTEPADPQLQDEELDVFLAGAPGLYAAAADAARALAARYARRVDFTQGPLSLQMSQRARAYRELARELAGRAEDGAAGGGIGVPSVGGLSESSIRASREDPDRVQNRATHDLHDFPGEPGAPEWWR